MWSLDITEDNDGYKIRKNGLSDYICYHCNIAFIFRNEFIDHNSIRHNDENPYHCHHKGCNYSCDILRNLKIHFEVVHEKKINYKYTCDVCNKDFYGKTLYDEHMRIHREKPHLCDYDGCNYSTVRRGSLGIHIESVHEKKLNYKCDYNGCDKIFGRKSTLYNHIQRVHEKKINYKCGHVGCTKGFYMKSDYDVHMRTHAGEKPFKCRDCLKRFRQSQQLKRHINDIHQKLKPYECGYCDKRFARKERLRIHLRIHAGENPYECQDCQRRFRHKSTWDKHQKKCKG